jgi:hypothetical protein
VAGLTAVNGALRRAAIGDERAFLASFGGPGPSRGLDHDLIYSAAPKRGVISASTSLVSALIPVIRLIGTGNDGSYWLSVTVRVPSGRAVGLDDLFTHLHVALRHLSIGARKVLLATNRCVRGSLAYPTLDYQAGFKPVAANYSHFALSPTGVVIGFEINQVAGSSCGRVKVTVPYSLVRADLSPIGERLIAGALHPH